MEKIGFVSLGCSKNLVDTEMIIGLLKKSGYVLEINPELADVIIINTCGFITQAKEEAINTILEMAQYKNEKCKFLIVIGCLVKRYKDELIKELPEVDLFISPDEYSNISSLINKLLNTDKLKSNLNYLDRILSTPNYMAYLKIAEGCSNMCTYCAIPMIRGPLQSRRKEDIIEEAKALYQKGIKELVIIAQDTSKYGLDIYGKSCLAELLDSIAKIGFHWIRVLYTYPESITQELLEVVNNNQNICAYFDIPIQHISDSVLKRMGRRGGSKAIKDTIENIRNIIKKPIIRTTVIVGFPGETEEDFNELYDYVSKIKFDRLGCFMYSKEDNTPAEKLDGHLSDEIKLERYNKIMALQQKISLEKNKTKIGKTYEMLIENIINNKIYGRTYMDQGDIDGYVIVEAKDNVIIGEFVKVKIVDVGNYDLKGEII